MNKLKIILFTISILFVIIFSVLNSKHTIIKGSFLNLDGFCTQTVKCEIYNDSTFELSYIQFLKFNKESNNDIFIKGKVKFQNDTIYLQSKEFNSKAVLKNNEIELLQDRILKLPLNKNISSVLSKSFSKKKDYSCFSSFIRKNDSDKKYKFIDLNKKQLNFLDSILNGIKDFEDIKNENYNKQYGSYIEENNDIIIYVFGISKFYQEYNYWKYFPVHVLDGGKGFFRAKINLTQGKVVYFNFHGTA